MLPRQHRIKSGSDFKAIMRSGRRVSTPSMTVFAHPNQLGFCRFGFVVSGGVGNAVVRNLVKRRLRATALKNLQAGSNLDIVVRANPQLAADTFDLLEQTLTRAISDLGKK